MQSRKISRANNSLVGFLVDYLATLSVVKYTAPNDRMINECGAVG
jgi:hypothetical protein